MSFDGEFSYTFEPLMYLIIFNVKSKTKLFGTNAIFGWELVLYDFHWLFCMQHEIIFGTCGAWLNVVGI